MVSRAAFAASIRSRSTSTATSSRRSSSSGGRITTAWRRARSPTGWVALCDGLGIARGADRDAFRDTYLDDDRFNWDQGLTRLALGQFMTGARSGVVEPVSVDPSRATPLLPAEIAGDFRADADALGLL